MFNPKEHTIFCESRTFTTEAKPRPCTCHVAVIERLEAENAELRQGPNIGKDPLKFSMEVERTDEACWNRICSGLNIQQPLVPDQTALVWRADISTCRSAYILEKARAAHRLSTISDRDKRVKELEGAQQWVSVKDRIPELTSSNAKVKNYVLAVDANGRMSIGYAVEHSSDRPYWIFSKPIGEVTHWMPLPPTPEPPCTR